MNLKQKKYFFIVKVSIFITGILILFLGFFPMYTGDKVYNSNFYEGYGGPFLGIPIILLGTTIFILSFLIQKNIVKEKKNTLIIMAILNSVYAFLILFFIMLLPVEDEFYNSFSGIVLYILSILLFLLVVFSSIIYFYCQHLFLSTKRKNKLMKEAFVKLRSLKELLDCGVITQEEFNEKREVFLKDI